MGEGALPGCLAGHGYRDMSNEICWPGGVESKGCCKCIDAFCAQLASHKVFLDHLLYARKHFMKGDCYDYFNQQSILGWCYRGGSAEDKVCIS